MHDSDKYDLCECIGTIISNYINDNIIHFYKYTFDESIKSHVFSIIKEQLEDTNTSNYDIEKLIDETLNYYYQYIMPRRSYKNSYTKHLPKVDKLKNIITKVKNTYQPEQRTEEWYIFRHNLVTASSAYKIFGSEALRNELICEKCAEYKRFDNKQVNIESAMHWGVKYEPVSVMYYEYINNTTVEDFGCLKHDKYYFLGASPDGIITDPTSKLYGRRLEIKNPKSREITGIQRMNIGYKCNYKWKFVIYNIVTF